MNTCTLMTSITGTRTAQMSRRENHTHIGIVTSQWLTVTHTTRTFTIGTAIESPN